MSAPSAEGLRVALAGGGTGGHLMPGLAVAEQLRRAGASVRFIGTARGLEARLVPEAGYPLDLIEIGGLKRSGWRRRLRSLAQLPAAIWHSVRLLRGHDIQVVLGIGGYASGPVLAAAALRGVPVVVLEVNARTGLANRLARPWVKMAAVNFAVTARDFRQATVTGIPVRAGFAQAETEPAVPPLVLVTGGSQGARALNQAVRAMHPPVGYQVLLQTGADPGHEMPAWLEETPFLAHMDKEITRACLVVCRAGASTLGELAAVGRPAILVPFPGAADDHQLYNAQAYADAGAAVLLEQSDLTPERLQAEMEQLLRDDSRRAAMERAVRAFAHPDAAAQIAKLVTTAAKK